MERLWATIPVLESLTFPKERAQAAFELLVALHRWSDVTPL